MLLKRKKRFNNIYHKSEKRIFDFFRWQFGLLHDDEPFSFFSFPTGDYVPPFIEPDFESIHNPSADTLQLTWIGHTTFLLQIGGLNFLTDPIFSDRCSPFSFIGPKRSTPPGVLLSDLPTIDAVIISHNHYDHLDSPTIKKLGNKPRFFVPLGLKDWFNHKGITNVEEHNWWGTTTFHDITLSAVPVQHFSRRTFTDTNTTLWCGWVLEFGGRKIFFAGDTGYAPIFRDIYNTFGSMHISLLPIGAYLPRWFMRPMHMDPSESVQAHIDLHSSYSVGMHWGTFKLSEEPLGEPPVYLEKVLKENGVTKEQFSTMKFGETRVFSW